MSYRYRDTRTGHFAKKKQWERSKVSEGGYIRRETTKKLLPEPDELLPLPEDEMIIDGTDLLHTIDDIEDWNTAYRLAEEYNVEEYEGGIDTGEKA